MTLQNPPGFAEASAVSQPTVYETCSFRWKLPQNRNFAKTSFSLEIGTVPKPEF
jgi:hypothetical protein